MEKLTFLPPPIGEDSSIHFTQDQAAVLGPDDNYILYSMIAAEQSSPPAEPAEPPVLVMSPLDHHAWGSLFVASFTLEKAPGQLRDLLAHFLQKHDIYVRFIPAAQATTGAPDKRLTSWVLPTVQVTFEGLPGFVCGERLTKVPESMNLDSCVQLPGAGTTPLSDSSTDLKQRHTQGVPCA